MPILKAPEREDKRRKMQYEKAQNRATAKAVFHDAHSNGPGWNVLGTTDGTESQGEISTL
jgi:hypothetical protein